MASTYITTGESKSARAKTMTSRVFSYIFLILVTLISLFPFYLLLINSTRSDAAMKQGFTLIPSVSFIDNFLSAWNYRALFFIPQGLLNSFIVAAASSILTVYFSAMTAYGLHVYQFRGRKVLSNFIMVIMMIPTQVSIVGLVQLCNNLHIMDTYVPLIIPAIAAPATYFYMKQYLESTFPIEVVEAARVDGCNEFRTFNMISLPMLKPALAVQIIFSFVASWNNFFTPALILNDREKWTLPIMLATLRAELNTQRGDYGRVYMIILMSILPVVVVYFIISKHIVQGVAMGAVKG